MKAVLLIGAVGITTACGPMRKRGGDQVTLTVLPAESYRFPAAARAVTESLRSAEVAGVDEKQISKVSLEVVQLSIECVEPSETCYEQVGKSLHADRLLFARVAPSGRKKLEVTVTLFDVDKKVPRSAHKVFANEQDATEGVADLVAEATR